MNTKHIINKGLHILLIASVILTFSCTAFQTGQAEAAAKTIHLKDTKIVLLEGDTHTLQLLNKSDKVISASKVTWTTSSKSVAKVSKKGVITAVGDGLATITAKYNKKKYTAKVYVYDKAQVDYSEIYEPIQAKHKEMTEVDMSKVIDIKKYAVNNPGDYNLLTNEEIEALADKTPEWTGSVTRAEALSDIDVLLRALKSTYAGYYYFGEENYKQAEADLIAWVSEQETVNVAEFETTMRQAFDFMLDAHAMIAQPTQVLDGFKYNYYYCEKQEFQKDENGYYKLAKGKKWYFQSFNDNRVTIELTLTEDGRLIYSPVLWCPASDVKNCKMTLKNSDGTKRTETLTWVQAKPYIKKSMRIPDFNYFDENGLVYISVRCFDNDPEYAKELQEFADSGKLARDAKVIILDTRSNGGGNDSYSRQFYKNLTGIDVQFPIACYNRSSKLARSASEFWWSKSIAFFQKARFVNNSIPIILLTDDNSGSSGESVMYHALGYDNVIVVGSNTAGYQITGNVFGVHLPNSAIAVNLTQSLMFLYDDQNVDGKGYAPDIWCNPVNALDAVYALIEKNGIIDKETVAKMKSNTDESEAKLPEKMLDAGETSYYSFTVDGSDFLKNRKNVIHIIDSNGKLLLDYEIPSNKNKKIAQITVKVGTKPDYKSGGNSNVHFGDMYTELSKEFKWQNETIYLKSRVKYYNADGSVSSKWSSWSEVVSFTRTPDIYN